MGSDREAGHLVAIRADFARLGALPPGVGFRVYTRTVAGRTVWLIGTKKLSRGAGWPPDLYPFDEVPPPGNPAAAATVRESAGPICAAVDALVEYNRALPRDRWPVNRLNNKRYKPLAGRRSEKLGELSLGQQIASLLGVPVFSFFSDVDHDDELACINEPGTVRRVVCQRGEWVLTYTAGRLAVSPEYPAFLSKIPGVVPASPVMPDDGSRFRVVAEEANAFIGAAVADGDVVIPDLSELVPIGERDSGGGYRVLD